MNTKLQNSTALLYLLIMNLEHWYKYQEYIYKLVAKMAGTL